MSDRIDELKELVEKSARETSEAFVDHREYVEDAFGKLEAKLDRTSERIEERFDRLEHKLDRFIEAQAKTNHTFSRRLRTLER